MSDYRSRKENYVKAVKRLNEANLFYKKDSKNSIYIDALIQRFEFTFELAWKTLKAWLEDQGFVAKINSPKGILRMAYEAGIIIEEQTWLSMLESRNITTHLYDEAEAIEIADSISNIYRKALIKLSKNI